MSRGDVVSPCLTVDLLAPGSWLLTPFLELPELLELHSPNRS